VRESACQRALTHLRTLFLCTFPPASEGDHVPSFVPFRAHSLLLACRTSCTRSQAHTHPFSFHTHTRDAAFHRVPRGPRPRPPVGRLGGACSRAHISPPMRPLRHSLKYNNLDEEVKKAVKDAAGSRVSITF
jgi:hypothetical protein